MGLVVRIPTTPGEQEGYLRLRAAARAGFDVPTRHEVHEDTVLAAATAVERCGWDPVRYLTALGYGVASVPSSGQALQRAPRERRALDPDESEWLAEVASSVAGQVEAGGDWPRAHLAELARLCYAGVALQVTVRVAPA